MSELRALLLTDVVDSTHLSTLLGDQDMAALWAAHDRVARDLLPPHGGREIDKTDGMLLLFEQASHALAYARAYHLALAGLHIPLKARAGLHVGPVILRENSRDDVARGAKPLEVEGLAKPTAARVMALARGGQTLLSTEALQALQDLGDSPWRVQSHGHWQMKGVSEPLELFEIGEGPFAALPDGDKSYRVARVGERWLPLQQIPNNLPEQLTSFVGRERELDDIKQRLRQTRLLTLLGMGGLGKTRLSLQAANELRAEFPDGVWFLDLAPLRDGALVLSEAAQALGVREEPGRPLLLTLTAHLKNRRTLLVMDNCEHLIKPCAQFAYAILKAAPQVRLLASSREALRVPGEQSYPILPLPVPAAGDSLALLARSTAVRLFVERVQQHRLDFALTASEAPAVAELVARLEGIPLALELAAARVRMFSVAEINQRLSDRYAELVDGDIVLEERQQTLRALVDWSYDMLSDAEQTAFRRLGVFVGGFELGAAEQVCALDAGGDMHLPALLDSLVDKSLLMTQTQGSGTRYRQLETLRDYARDRLVQDGELAATALAHCQHYFVVAKQIRDGMQGAEQGRWAQCGDEELDNLRAAFSLAQAAPDDTVFVAVKMAIALQNFWILRGHATEGRSRIKTLLDLPAVRDSDFFHAHALYVGASLACSQSDHGEALRLLSASLSLRRRLESRFDVAATLSTMAVSTLSAGDAQQARALDEEALLLFRQCGFRLGEAIALQQLGQIDVYLGQHALADTHLQQALALARELKHPETEAEAELLLGQVALAGGDAPAAGQRFEQALKICQAAGDRRGEAHALGWLARLDLRAGRLEQAGPRLSQALTAFNAFEMREQLLACLEDHVDLALQRARLAQAVQLASATEHLRTEARLQRSAASQTSWQALLDQLRGGLVDEDFQALWQQGHFSDTQGVLAAALALSQGQGQP